MKLTRRAKSPRVTGERSLLGSIKSEFWGKVVRQPPTADDQLPSRVPPGRTLWLMEDDRGEPPNRCAARARARAATSSRLLGGPVVTSERTRSPAILETFSTARSNTLWFA